MQLLQRVHCNGGYLYSCYRGSTVKVVINAAVTEGPL